MLDAIQNEDAVRHVRRLRAPAQGPAPAEFMHFVKKGLRREPAARYQNVGEMIDLLEARSTGA